MDEIGKKGRAGEDSYYMVAKKETDTSPHSPLAQSTVYLCVAPWSA